MAHEAPWRLRNRPVRRHEEARERGRPAGRRNASVSARALDRRERGLETGGRIENPLGAPFGGIRVRTNCRGLPLRDRMQFLTRKRRDLVRTSMLPRVPKNVSVIRTLRTQPISLAQDVTHPLRPTLLQGGTPMQVREFMSKDPVCCNPESSLGDVARLMVDHHCGDGRRTRKQRQAGRRRYRSRHHVSHRRQGKEPARAHGERLHVVAGRHGDD